MQLLTGFLLALVISSLAYLARALNISGAAGALILGTLIYGLGGLPWMVVLLVFFISSSLLSRLSKNRKQELGEKFSKGHRRDIGQVLANGGVAGVFVLLHHFYPDAAWPWLGFSASLAAANADTWATELGVLSRSAPHLITTGKPVERGDSGGISPAGLVAALGGSMLVALAAVLLWPVMQSPTGLSNSLTVIALIALAGLAGSLVDSLLGATLQAIYTCPSCKKETERHPLHACGTETTLTRGWRWLNNDAVNAACTLGGAVVMMAFLFLLPSVFGTNSGGISMNNISFTSTVFTNGGTIPVKHTCDGEDLSPALEWGELPAGTKSLAVIAEDPDAPVGLFVHWVIYNIPPALTGLPEGVAKIAQVSGTGMQGINGFGRNGYGGPCPPRGKPHRYFFNLYALDLEPRLPADLTRAGLLTAMQGHILGQGQWMGTYGR